MGTFMEAFKRNLAESGELVETRGLTAPVFARPDQPPKPSTQPTPSSMWSLTTVPSSDALPTASEIVVF
jgi:hypothetical protein